MNRLSLALILIASAQGATAECLKVSERQVEAESMEFGGFEVQWMAQVENRCDSAFEADLTVSFKDESGDSVYQVRHWTLLEANETRDLTKQVYIADREIESIADIEIGAEEREYSF